MELTGRQLKSIAEAFYTELSDVELETAGGGRKLSDRKRNTENTDTQDAGCSV